MTDHWKTALEHLPIITMATGSPRIDWGSLANIALTGAVSGLIASQVMVVRLEERLTETTRRVAQFEATLAAHMVSDAEIHAAVRERISTCEILVKK